jgi:arsenate reductase (thioredoxin)
LADGNDMNKIRVLFLCVHNSARSQIAEAYLNELGKGLFEAESAGFEPGSLNPLAVEVMKEDGIDISGNKIDSVYTFFSEKRFYGYIITVCDESKAQKCPIFPGVPVRYHWDIEDPALFEGAYDEKLLKTRMVRDSIKEKIKDFMCEVRSGQ